MLIVLTKECILLTAFFLGLNSQVIFFFFKAVFGSTEIDFFLKKIFVFTSIRGDEKCSPNGYCFSVNYKIKKIIEKIGLQFYFPPHPKLIN